MNSTNDQVNGPLISVVMPSYNSGKYITDAIESVLQQTYTNWELIIIDGHSKDNTIEIIESYIKKDSRIKLYYDNGGGLGAVLKLACSFTKGDYIARLDADDISYPDRFEMQMKYLLSHPKVAVVSCGAMIIDEDGVEQGYFFPLTWPFQILLEKRNSIIHSGVLMKKDIYLQSGEYPPITSSEDYFLWCRMRRYGEVRIMEHPYVKYRITDGALSNLIPSSVGQIIKPYLDIKSLTDEQYNEINRQFKEKRENNVYQYNKKRHVSPYENYIYSKLSLLFSSKIAFKIVYIMKNLFGVIAYHSTNM